ncbi:hypothetical protein AgCh_011212 [Apium graveolens]
MRKKTEIKGGKKGLEKREVISDEKITYLEGEKRGFKERGVISDEKMRDFEDVKEGFGEGKVIREHNTCFGEEYPRETNFKLIGYSDADFAGCKIDRNNTSGSCQFLGGRLVSWFSKKQKSISTSTVEAEYIAAGSCCAQILWTRNQLLDYGLKYSKIPIYYDNHSAIAMTGNSVQHSMTKHISIRYHFIREYVMEGTVELRFVPTDQQLADIFTKPLCEATFTRLVNELGMITRQFSNADK